MFRLCPHARRAQGLLDRNVDRVELVVACDLLSHRAATKIFEHDEVTKEVEETPLVKTLLGSSPGVPVSNFQQASRHVIVRQGLNHSRPAPSEPMRAWTPSEISNVSL